MSLHARAVGVFVLPLLVSCAASAPKGAETSGREEARPHRILPLVRVRLYASGMGYFERRGDLTAGQKTLPVPTGHLDDALKSLVLLSSGSEQVTLSFLSRVSPAVARARGGLAAAENAALSYDLLLASLRGEQVELTLEATPGLSSRTLRGRVVEVVSVKPSHPSYDHGPPGATIPREQTRAEETERLQLVLLSEHDELIRFDVTELVSVRPRDPRITERLQAALSARTATRANPTEWLALAGGAAPARDVRLGYLAETPTWRTSYRLVLPDKGQAELQAWALIHNDTDETWRNVKLELADGHPSSLLFPLAAPRYQRRELATPDEELSSVPQLSTTTPDTMWGDFSDYPGELVERLGESSHAGGGTGSGQGFGSGHGRLGGRHTRAALPQSREGASDLLWIGDLAKTAEVVPTTERAVCVYSVAPALDLLPQHSALLPFLKESVSARSIVWFNSPSAEPQRAVGISNNTSNTLPEGPIAVYAKGGFLGEAMLSGLKPGERQFARIGSEPDLDLSTPSENSGRVRKHVDFQSGSLSVHFLQTEQKRLVFDNRTGSTAEIYVGLPIVTNATVEGCDRIDFDTTAATPLAVFSVSAGAGTERPLVVRQALAEPTSLEDLGLDALDELIQDASLPAEERAVLTRGRSPLEARLAVTRQQSDLQLELDAAESDLERLKEASTAVSGPDTGDASAPVVARLLQTHDEVRKLEARKRALEKELDARTRALGEVLSGLSAFRPAILEQRRQAEAAATSP